MDRGSVYRDKRNDNIMKPTPTADGSSVTLAAAVRRIRRCQLDIQSDGRQCRGNSSTSRKALNHIGRSGHNRPTSCIFNRFTFQSAQLSSCNIYVYLYIYTNLQTL